MRATKNASSAALVGIWTILVTAFVVTILYVGRQLLIPIALAAMLTFLLAPLVGYLERGIGRIAAVLILDIKPRRMTEREKRLLQIVGGDVMEEIKRRDSVGPPRVPVA